MIGDLIYGLCALTAFLCAYLLLQAYMRTKYRLLLWSGLCFIGLTLNNVILIIDKFVVPEVDLWYLRGFTAIASSSIFLYGLVWDEE